MHFVKSKKPVKRDHPTLGKVQAEVEYPQPKTLKDLIDWAGNEENLVLFGQNAIRDGAKRAAGTAIANAPETSTLEMVVIDAQNASRNFKFGGDRANSGREAKERNARAIAALESGKEIPRELFKKILRGDATDAELSQYGL